MAPTELAARLTEIKETEFRVREVPVLTGSEGAQDRLAVVVGMDYELGTSRDTVHIALRFEVNCPPDGWVLIAVIGFEFSVKDLQTHVKEAGDSLEADFLLPFVRSAMSAARGYIAARALGYAIGRFPLPFIDAEELTRRAVEGKQKSKGQVRR